MYWFREETINRESDILMINEEILQKDNVLSEIIKARVYSFLSFDAHAIFNSLSISDQKSLTRELISEIYVCQRISPTGNSMSSSFLLGDWKGKAIRLVVSGNLDSPIQSGEIGTIQGTDGLGTIYVNWTNGITHSLTPGEDVFELLAA